MSDAAKLLSGHSPAAVESDVRRRAFEKAEALAKEHGLHDYMAWRNMMELRFNVMPPGYFSHPEAMYAGYVHDSLQWQRAQEEANRTGVAMVNELFGRFTR